MKPIYLDNNSTTMIDPRVLERMLPYMKDDFGNSSSTEHAFGWKSNDAVNQSRESIANLLSCSPNEIIFTSGATESNNISILGTMEKCGYDGHIVTPKTEHKSVLDIVQSVEKKGAHVTYLDVMADGLVDINKFKDSLRDDTRMVSVMMANNEIGVIQPIELIGSICREREIIFHVDAAQSFGKIDIDLSKLSIDLMSISAHKVYGPKGVGALYINSETMSQRLGAVYHGGGHERGLRPGTLATHNIVGFGASAEIAKNEKDKDAVLINKMRDSMIKNLQDGFGDIILNGCMIKRIPGNINVSFSGLNNEPFIQKLRSIAVSSGSACTSSNPAPSHVLSAIGISKSTIKSTIRIGIGKFNTQNEIDAASSYILEITNKLRKQRI